MLSTPASVFRLVCVAVVILSLLAVLPWPYGYYQLLRVIVFFAAVYCAMYVRSTGGDGKSLVWSLFAAALIFNPFLPIHLPREIWAIFNIAAAGLFGFAAYRTNGK
ncbi:hypothetical protein CK224_09830 [Mesorhizobium sp. WSM3862]|nr:hypothetical protein CK224_09830 [Mesorhizobium sp. WSM3862]